MKPKLTLFDSSRLANFTLTDVRDESKTMHVQFSSGSFLPDPLVVDTFH
jgi:hypothetical protein